MIIDTFGVYGSVWIHVLLRIINNVSNNFANLTFRSCPKFDVFSLISPNSSSPHRKNCTSSIPYKQMLFYKIEYLAIPSEYRSILKWKFLIAPIQFENVQCRWKIPSILFLVLSLPLCLSLFLSMMNLSKSFATSRFVPQLHHMIIFHRQFIRSKRINRILIITLNHSIKRPYTFHNITLHLKAN